MVLLYSKNANIVYIGSNGGKDTCQAYLVLHCYLQFLKFQTYLILFCKYVEMNDSTVNYNKTNILKKVISNFSS